MTQFEYFLVPGGTLTNESICALLVEHGIDPVQSRTNITLGKMGLRPAFRLKLDEILTIGHSRITDQWIRSFFYRRQPAKQGKDPGPITTVPKRIFEDARNQPSVRKARRDLRAAIERKVRREFEKT